MEKRGVTTYHDDNVKSAEYNPYERDLIDNLSDVVKDKKIKKNEQQSIKQPTTFNTADSREWISRSL